MQRLNQTWIHTQNLVYITHVLTVSEASCVYNSHYFESLWDIATIRVRGIAYLKYWNYASSTSPFYQNPRELPAICYTPSHWLDKMLGIIDWIMRYRSKGQLMSFEAELGGPACVGCPDEASGSTSVAVINWLRNIIAVNR